jgi:predicted enzyme related to lactoylglutathione lyase
MAENTPNIYRIIVPVAEPEKAFDFYSRLLAVEGRSVGGGRYYFDCGAVILALLKSDAQPNTEYIYFSVADLEAVFARAHELDCLSKTEVHGAAAGEITVRPWGERCFYAYDPSGNGLCFVDEKTLFTGRR